MDIPSLLQGAAGAAQGFFGGPGADPTGAGPSPAGGIPALVDGLVSGLERLAASAVDFAASNLEALQPDEGDSLRWFRGPWLDVVTIADDESGTDRIDDAPDSGTRLVDGGMGTGRSADRSRMDGHGPDASRAGSTLFGVEGGLMRFLDLSYEATSELGRIYSAGAIDFIKGQAALYADAGIDWDSYSLVLGLGGQVLAELIGAHYEAGYDTPTIELLGREVGIELTGRLDAAVHAFARAWMEVSVGGRNALQVGGRAFAGASATLTGQAELAPFADVHGSLTAWAGMGAECTLGVEVDLADGDFALQHSAGAAIGYGVSYDWGVSVDVFEVGGLLYEQTGLEDPRDAAESDLGDLLARAGRFLEAVVAVVTELSDGDAETLTAAEAVTTIAAALVDATTRPVE